MIERLRISWKMNQEDSSDLHMHVHTHDGKERKRKRNYSKLGAVVYPAIPALKKQEQNNYHKFEASLISTVKLCPKTRKR